MRHREFNLSWVPGDVSIGMVLLCGKGALVGPCTEGGNGIETLSRCRAY